MSNYIGENHRMFLRLKSLVPDVIKKNIKSIWHKIRPPRIKLTKFVQNGCIFEITTKMEKIRIMGYGDESDSLGRVLSEIKPEDVFFDIGSCLGLYAIHAASLGSSVFAFEPDPGYRKRLIKNIKINRLNKKIKVLDFAISDVVGTTTLYTDGIEGNSPSLGLIGKRGSIKVKTSTIDNIIESGKFPFPDIIKIDIEGAEIMALRGMDKTLSSGITPKYLFFEFHPKFLPIFKSSVEECTRIIESYGYNNVFISSRLDQLHYFYKKGER